MNSKFIIGLLFTSLLLFAIPDTVYGAVRCETQYGGGQVCVNTGSLQINKQVKVVTGANGEHEWRDYLGIQAGKRFLPGEELTFRLSVKNTGTEKFDKVEVVDTLPSFLSISSGNLKSEIQFLDPGQTRDIILTAKVVSGDKLEKVLDCAVNVGEVRGKDVLGNEGYDKDSTEVCIEKSVGGVSDLPKAGIPNIYLFGSAGILFLGIFLTRFVLRKSWQ